jgi:hypothetical protein
LGASVLNARFLTLSLKGDSPQVPANQSARKEMQNINTPKQTWNMKHRGIMTMKM